ncbi:MAG TPA: glycosyltransferase family 39 protein [Polyangia bacterium]
MNPRRLVEFWRESAAIFRREGGHERWRLLTGAVVLATLVGFFAETRGGHVTMFNDSVYYVDATHAVFDGDPLVSRLYFAERVARASNGEQLPDLHRWVNEGAEPGELDGPRAHHPWTAWPPGFPILAAPFFAALPDGPAVFVCQAVALALLILLVAALGRSLRGERFGFVAALVCAALPCVHDVARAYSSDLWFAVLVVLALWATIEWRRCRRLRWLVLASVAAAVAFSLRYLGVILCAFVVLSAWPRLWPLLVSGVISAVVVVPVFLRNKLVTGFFGGVERLPSDRSLLLNLRDAGEASLTGLLPLVREVPGPFDLVLSGAVVLALVLVTVHRVASSSSNPATDIHGVGILLGFAAAYVTALVVIRTRVLTDEINQRLLLPALIPVGVAVAASFSRRLRTARGAQLFRLMVPASVVAIALNIGFAPTEGFAKDDAVSRALQRAIDTTEAIDTPDARPAIYSNRAVELTFVLGRQVHWLPAPAALDAIVNRQPAVFVVKRSSLYFPCPAFESAYVRWLGLGASRVTRVGDFEVFVFFGRRPVRDPLEFDSCWAGHALVHCCPSALRPS